MKKIVVYATDEKFVNYTAVSIVSLLRHKKKHGKKERVLKTKKDRHLKQQQYRRIYNINLTSLVILPLVIWIKQNLPDFALYFFFLFFAPFQYSIL